jgi:hypothetical protein
VLFALVLWVLAVVIVLRWVDALTVIHYNRDPGASSAKFGVDLEELGYDTCVFGLVRLGRGIPRPGLIAANTKSMHIVLRKKELVVLRKDRHLVSHPARFLQHIVRVQVADPAAVGVVQTSPFKPWRTGVWLRDLGWDFPDAAKSPN